MNVTNSADRVCRLLDLSLDCERVASQWFYCEARRFAGWLAGVSNITVEQAASIIAVLSPRNVWLSNQHDAVAVCLGSDMNFDRVNGKGFQALPRDVKRARDIRNGKPISQCLLGVKVNAFQQNILHPERESSHLPIDRHIARAIFGLSMTDHDITRKLSNGGYSEAESVIHSVAHSNRERPILVANLLRYIVRRIQRDKGQLSLSCRDLEWRPVYLNAQYPLTNKYRQTPALDLIGTCPWRPWLHEIASGFTGSKIRS